MSSTEITFSQKLESASCAYAEAKKQKYEAKVQTITDYFIALVDDMIAKKESYQQLMIDRTANGIREMKIGDELDGHMYLNEIYYRYPVIIGTHATTFGGGDKEPKKYVDMALVKSDILKKLRTGFGHERFEIKVVSNRCYYSLELSW